MGEHDVFSHHNLADIPENTLQELEHNALWSTQLAKPAVQAPKPFQKQKINLLVPVHLGTTPDCANGGLGVSIFIQSSC